MLYYLPLLESSPGLLPLYTVGRPRHDLLDTRSAKLLLAAGRFLLFLAPSVLRLGAFSAGSDFSSPFYFPAAAFSSLGAGF